MYKDYMIKKLHRLYREDNWIKQLFNSVGIDLENLDAYLEEVLNNEFFDTCTEKGLHKYEKDLGIIYKSTQSIEDRRATVQAKWLAQGKCTLELLQRVANSWKNGSIALEFIGGKIHVKFISPIGVPTDIDTLIEMLNDTKPAHLGLYYTFMWLTWGDAKAFGTWGEHKANGNWIDMKRLKEGN